MKIIIAGGTGQVGTILARHFDQNGHSVVVLSRSLQKTPWRVVHWDGSTLGPWLDELDCSDVLINLASRNVNCRYTQKNRRAILDSRVLSTRALHQAIAEALFLRRYMLALLRERNAVIKRVAESSECEQHLPSTSQRSKDAAL